MAEDSIAAQAVRGSAFTIIASGITTVSGFARSVLLARLLLPEHFGVVTLALFFLSLTTQVQRFGFNKAFIHRDDNSPVNLTTFASLSVGFAGVAVVLALVAAPVLTRLYPEQSALAPVLVVLALFEMMQAFNSVTDAILVKDLRFRRLAALDVASSLTMTVVAPVVALAGGGVWALVTERVTGVLVRTAGLWLFRRPWHPTFGISRALARWYLRFGVLLFVNDGLAFLLDQFDDFWTGTFLGATALGFYSRAYEFARYPRRILSGPLVRVFFPTFASLQKDRLRLSKAFYRVCSAIVRVGFLAFGSFAMVAPEFIHIFLGDKWMPMAFTFQLMLIYSLLDPLIAICTYLLAAVGQPQTVTKIQPVRLIVFIPSVFLLGRKFGINGVAVAADLMLLIGLALLFWQARRFVDFSLWRMFLVPSLGLSLAGLAALGVQHLVPLPGDWWRLIGKVIVAFVVYSSVSLLLERQEYVRIVQLGWRLIFSQASVSSSVAPILPASKDVHAKEFPDTD